MKKADKKSNDNNIINNAINYSTDGNITDDINIININAELDKIVQFIKDQLAETGFRKLVVGLSGGIDSSVTAALAVKAIGKDNVLGIMMPYRASHPNSLKHAIEVAELLEMQYEIIDISPMVDSYFNKYEPQADILRRGNRMARERMCVLYDFSAKYQALVAGTGNRSELLIGYCTQYGDCACAFEPLGHLYKTHIYKLAELLELPECVIHKKPTADLWDNQTDEDEIGITYARLDNILHNMLDLQKTDEQLVRNGYNQEELTKVKNMVKNSEFKRHMPPQPKK